jgi:hypothetical protein
MNDLLPGDVAYVNKTANAGKWAGYIGRVTYASDGHGDSRTYDLTFPGSELPDATFCASEVTELSSGAAAASASPSFDGTFKRPERGLRLMQPTGEA